MNYACAPALRRLARCSTSPRRAHLERWPQRLHRRFPGGRADSLRRRLRCTRLLRIAGRGAVNDAGRHRPAKAADALIGGRRCQLGGKTTNGGAGVATASSLRSRWMERTAGRSPVLARSSRRGCARRTAPRPGPASPRRAKGSALTAAQAAAPIAQCERWRSRSPLLMARDSWRERTLQLRRIGKSPRPRTSEAGSERVVSGVRRFPGFVRSRVCR
jgi:hypothetical protein